MSRPSPESFLGLLCLLGFIGCSLGSSHMNPVETRLLKAEEELWEETLPLRSGSRVYKLEGIKANTRYEVKISYPASIPAFFSLQFLKGNSDSGLNMNRRLLNTEKIIFKTDSIQNQKICVILKVLVTMEPEGVVALKNTREREIVVFDIVCNELLLGKISLWVVLLILLCLVAAFTIPLFLPPYLLPSKHIRVPGNQTDPKTS